jgi:ribosomal protein S18 acetylase RimI-like enzyme
MSDGSPIERLGADQRDEAVEVLCEAFCDYPVFRYVLKDAGKGYSHGLRTLIGHFTDTRLDRGCPVLGIRSRGRLIAAANVNPPVPGPPLEDAEERWARIGEVTGAAALERFSAFAQACEELAPEGRFTHLGMIGVRADCQGEGHGGRILRHLAEESRKDPDSGGVLLTTETRGNVGYYESHGYAVLGSRQVEELETWTLLLRT